MSNIEIVRKNLGPVTAYKYAVSQGYTGTEQEFAALMASYATVAEEAESAKNNAVDAKTAAEAAQAAAEDAADRAEEAASQAERAIEVDATVSQPGRAADAKATRDLTDSKIDKSGIGEVTPQNMQIIDAVMSPNLLDESTLINGKFIQKNGAEGDGDYYATDYIPVEEGEDYYFTWEYLGSRVPASLRFLACYDSDKTIISSAGSDVMITTYPITIAEGVKYVRLSFSRITLYKKYQFEKGSVPSEYQAYGLSSAVIKDEYLPDNPVAMEDIPAFHLVEGQNLLNQNDPDFTSGFLTIDGTVGENASYKTSGFIAVKEGDWLIGSYVTSGGASGKITLRTVACYNNNKTALNAKGKYSVGSFIVPSGVSFVRICYSFATYGNIVQICKTDSGSYKPYKEYEEPHYEIKDEYLTSGKAPLHVFLPKEIYVAVGRTIELYNEQVVLDHEKYHFRWVCGKGSATKRKFSITGTTAGDQNLALYLYDDEMNICWVGVCVIHIVTAINPVKKILPIGDSLTNWKAWLQETMLLSNNNITFVGTRYSGQSVDSEGNIYASGTIHSEGRSGWGADSYLADSEYTFDNRYDGVAGVDGSANPFWDGEKFSLLHYLTTQTGVDTPDAVQIFLGTNDVGSGVATAVTNISAMVTSIRAEYANIPIFVCNTIYRSNQNGYGSVGDDAYSGGAGASAWQYEQDIKIMDLMIGLAEALADVTGVYFIPLATCMDREYSFGQVMTKVNPRSTVEIPMPAESVHPQASGYYQMADLMYSAYCGILT